MTTPTGATSERRVATLFDREGEKGRHAQYATWEY
jgi:hypothetical protein